MGPRTSGVSCDIPAILPSPAAHVLPQRVSHLPLREVQHNPPCKLWVTSTMWGSWQRVGTGTECTAVNSQGQKRERISGGGGVISARSVALGLERNSITMHPKHEPGAPRRLTASEHKQSTDNGQNLNTARRKDRNV